MLFESFIVKRHFFQKSYNRNISSSLINVVIFGIALCLAVMIISFSVLFGFKKEIREKISGFNGHIHIINHNSNLSFETSPIIIDSSINNTLQNFSSITFFYPYALKAGIIKTDKDIQGIVLKGIDNNYNWEFISKNIIEGEIPVFKDSIASNKVVISKFLSNFLNLSIGDTFIVYFVQNPPRARKLIVSGIYKTDVEEIDKYYLICDIRHIQKLNSWANNQISGIEVFIDDFEKLDEQKQLIAEQVSYLGIKKNTILKVESIKDLYPQIFDWLNLMDMNVIVILLLMLVVSGFNMISGLIILILDRTQLIGIFKALGANNNQIRNIFLLQSVYLIVKGLFIGNIVGIALCLIQQHFKIITLDPDSYYLNYVPIFIDYSKVFILNIGTIIIIFMMLLLPSQIIARIQPAETIKFT